MRFARLVLPLLLALPARAAELRHRLYLAPAELTSTDTRELARLLVDRIHRECDLAGTSTSTETVLGEDAELIMMAPSRLLAAIARDGFLNQHQAGTTGGQSRENDRVEAEQELAMLRLPLGSKSYELLPKYAVLDVKRGDLGAYRLPTRYGDVAIVFKKEVWERATWTYADSLDFSQRSGRFDAGGDANPVLARTVGYRRKTGDRNRCGNYCEGQIWGKLTLEDVAYAMVRDSEPVPAALARAGIPVYGYSVPDSTSAVVDAGRTAQYVRGPRRTGPAAMEGAAPRRRAAPAERLALFAQSERPWAEFKPRLLESLDAGSGPQRIDAIALAAEHRDDPDVAASLERLKRAPESAATEWLERLDKKQLCAPR
jgi:hypothetical protein